MFLKPELSNGLKNKERSILRSHTSLPFSSVYDTVREMQKMITESMTDPAIRYQAEEIIKDTLGRNYAQELETIYNYVVSHVRYTADIHNIETLKNPSVMMREIEDRGLAFGDCDDFTMFTGALLKSIGYETRIVIMKSLWNTNDDFNHVYLEALRPDTSEWVALDATAQKEFGFMPQAKEKKYFSV